MACLKKIPGNPKNNFCKLYIVSFVAQYIFCSCVDIVTFDFPLFSQWKKHSFQVLCDRKTVFTDLALEILKMVVKCLRFHGVLQSKCLLSTSISYVKENFELHN